jgi:uncharacterized membrane protein
MARIDDEVRGSSHRSHAPLAAMPQRARLVRTLVLVVVVLTVIGLVWLWPGGDDESSILGQRLPTADATIREVSITPCAGTAIEDDVDCYAVEATVTSGEVRGVTASLELPVGGSTPRLSAGDDVLLAYDVAVVDGPAFYFYDFQRRTPLILLVMLFVFAVVLFGGWRGLGALAGLLASVVVLIVFTLPAILEGQQPVLVALVSAAFIGLVALHLAHGFGVATGVAALGTFASLLLTGILAAVFVGASNLTGLLDDNALLLDVAAGQVDLQGIVLAGIVIGSLGVLDDMTVTQVSTVAELSRAQPMLKRRTLFDAALRIGRDHVSSTVNTLVLAYVGASLPLLLLFTEAQRSLGDIATSEIVATEIIRALIGSIGIVASVPITTALAVWVLRPAVSERRPTA